MSFKSYFNYSCLMFNIFHKNMNLYKSPHFTDNKFTSMLSNKKKKKIIIYD